jgi:hypothetical protein
MAPDVQLVAVSFSDRPLVILHFVTKQQWRGDDPGWEREASDEAIALEVERAGLTPNTGWRRVAREEIPSDWTEHRAEWVDNGSAIVLAA